MEITKRNFLSLFERVIAQFQNRYETQFGEQPSLTQTFGLKGFDNTKWVLEHSIKLETKSGILLKILNKGKPEHKRFQFNSRYLYDKKMRVDRMSVSDEEYIKINSPYDQLLFLYLGFKKYQDFENSLSSNETEYVGYYYSYAHHEIKTFNLSIDFKREPNFEGVSHQEYFVKEQGFHDNPDNPIYEGYGYRLEGKLQLILWNKHDGDRLRIILESGDNAIDQTIMRGSVQAVSSGPGRPLSALEVVVTRKDTEMVSTKDEVRIKRYLMLHRYNFIIKTEAIGLKSMKARGTSVDIMRHFVGVWRAYRYDEKYSQITSALIWVNDDYRIACLNNYYEDQDNFNEQVCMPNVTIDDELNTRTIHLECYPKIGAKIISSMMLDLPSSSEKSIIEGVITLVGRNGKFPSSRGIILDRDELLEKKVFELNDYESQRLFLKKELDTKINIKPKIKSKLNEIEDYNTRVQ